MISALIIVRPDTQFPYVMGYFWIATSYLISNEWNAFNNLVNSREIHTNSYLMELMLKWCVCQLLREVLT